MAKQRRGGGKVNVLWHVPLAIVSHSMNFVRFSPVGNSLHPSVICYNFCKQFGPRSWPEKVSSLI